MQKTGNMVQNKNANSIPLINQFSSYEKASIALLSVVSNSLLVALKVIVGVSIGSVSVLSEAIHSGVDLLAAFIALLAVRASSKPADKAHPFGHGKFENLSGTIEALLIFFAAAWIIYEAIKRLIHPAQLDYPEWGILVMLVSSAANILVSRRLFKVAKRTDSVALEADAWHLRTDVYTSAGVMAGLFLITFGEKIFPGKHFHWIDPVAAMAVALLIIKTAYDLTIKSTRDLLDECLPAEEEALIRQHISELSPIVRGFHRLKTRKSGNSRYVEFDILVDAEMTVEKSHQITDKLILLIREHYPNTILTIHTEPCRGDCVPACSDDCLLDSKERLIINKHYNSK